MGGTVTWGGGLGLEVNFSKQGDGIGINVGEWGRVWANADGVEMRAGFNLCRLECEYAESNAETLQILQIILHKFVETIIRYNQL